MVGVEMKLFKYCYFFCLRWTELECPSSYIIKCVILGFGSLVIPAKLLLSSVDILDFQLGYHNLKLS